MNDSREHVDFDALNDYVDGVLDQTAATAVTHHLVTCSVCSKQHADLENVLSSVRDLPRSVLPPEDLWADLKDNLEHRKQVMLPTAGVQPIPGVSATGRRVLGWRGRAWLAAAAIVLVALSSGITAIVLQSRFERQIAQDRKVNAPEPGVPNPVMLPASFRHAEGEYNRAIDELAQAVDAQRTRLNPETIRTVDRSLAVIDSAIAEAKAALVADPSNATLVDLLSASYQRKLDLLRRTSELSSRT